MKGSVKLVGIIKAGVSYGSVKAFYRAVIHLVVLAVTAVHFDDAGLITKGFRV